MEYGEAVTGLFAKRGDESVTPEVVRTAGPARRLRDACEPLAMHAVWSPRTNADLAGLGLEFVGAYVLGRAASLGEPVGAVVASAFAWFEPGLVASVYEAARAATTRPVLLATRDAATAASLRELLGDDDPTTVADLVADAVEGADGTGRPLFSALRARGRPSDPAQRLWWSCDMVREHRGDSHVAASAAAGVGPVEMNILTELWLGMPLLSYTATRGWPMPAMRQAVAALERRSWLVHGQLTEAGRSARAAIESSTDGQEQTIVDAIGLQLGDVCDALNNWSARCIAAGVFPSDPLKRAAG